jgi:hypothetical protein
MISYVDHKHFSDLYNLNILDLSGNNLLFIGPNSFLNLNYLKYLNLNNNYKIKIQDSSLIGLNSIKDIYIQMALFINETFKACFVGAIKARVRRKVLSRFYYESINIISDDFVDSLNGKCKIVSYFIKLNLHFNLKDDYQVENFLNTCNKF